MAFKLVYKIPLFLFFFQFAADTTAIPDRNWKKEALACYDCEVVQPRGLCKNFTSPITRNCSVGLDIVNHSLPMYGCGTMRLRFETIPDIVMYGTPGGVKELRGCMMVNACWSYFNTQENRDRLKALAVVQDYCSVCLEDYCNGPIETTLIAPRSVPNLFVLIIQIMYFIFFHIQNVVF